MYAVPMSFVPGGVETVGDDTGPDSAPVGLGYQRMLLHASHSEHPRFDVDSRYCTCAVMCCGVPA